MGEAIPFAPFGSTSTLAEDRLCAPAGGVPFASAVTRLIVSTHQALMSFTPADGCFEVLSSGRGHYYSVLPARLVLSGSAEVEEEEEEELLLVGSQRIDAAPDADDPRDTGPDTGLICLVRLLQMLGLPADDQQLRHQYAEPGRPISAEAMVRAIKRLDLKGRLLRSNAAELARLPTPAIVEMASGDFMVLGGVRDGALLLCAATMASSADSSSARHKLSCSCASRSIDAVRRIGERESLSAFSRSASELDTWCEWCEW